MELLKYENQRPDDAQASLGVAIDDRGLVVEAWERVDATHPPLGRCPSEPPKPATLTLCGSNTIGSDLAPALATEFLFANGSPSVLREEPVHTSLGDETAVRGTWEGRPIEIRIRDRGSDTAFDSQRNLQCDIGMSSMQTNGPGALREHVIGVDGIAVIVHRTNPLEWISVAELREVFRGGITEWSKLKGLARPKSGSISVYLRDEDSGTRKEFEKRVMGGLSFVNVSSTSKFSDSDKLAAAVARDVDAIGFVGRPFTGAAKFIRVGDSADDAVLPSNDTIRTEDYFLHRRLRLVTASASNDLRDAFVQFALSPEGQRLVVRNRFVDLTIQWAAPAGSGRPLLYSSALPQCNGSCATRYPPDGAARLSVDFRFEFGSFNLDNRGQRDVERVRDFLATLPNTELELLGFTDNVCTGGSCLPLSLKRAQAVQVELAHAGVQVPISIVGLGSALPVGPNYSPDGQASNRRVEVWVTQPQLRAPLPPQQPRGPVSVTQPPHQ
jgi:phosphate transport system substrate-binding protein